jgi:hypothetical protein
VIQIGIAVGVVATFIVGLFGAMALNITLGPSTNTIEMCKTLDREGYLADECFDEYGLIERGCRRVTQ